MRAVLKILRNTVIFVVALMFAFNLVSNHHIERLNRQLLTPPGAKITAGAFSETEAPELTTPTPQNPEYAPSQAVQAAAVTHLSNHGLSSRSWYSYHPAQAEGPLPVLVLLHGAGRSGLSMIEIWQATADQHGIALIAPNAMGPGWPLSRPDPGLITAMIDRLDQDQALDRSRIYLFGHSNGAQYAQLLLNQAHGPWRAAVLHGGFTDAAQLRPGPAKPLRLYLGSRDHLFSTEAARQNGARSAELGHDTDLVLIPDHSHWFYEIGPKLAEHAWGWLQQEP